jgi:hypothetical protein
LKVEKSLPRERERERERERRRDTAQQYKIKVEER